jgi:MinD-like ATPase involved in chromosome partitioning or flagellar assembly
MPNGDPSQGQGKIVTFYSFKGGTGRTMALANVAWILAANGMRVLIADWDLESPGLHRFFQPLLGPKVSEKPGIVDFIRRYEWAAVEAGIHPDELDGGSEESKRAASGVIAAIVDAHIDRVKDHAIPLNWQFPDEGVLHFLSSGKQTNGDYQMTLSALNWDNFYDNLYGAQFFDALRALMKSHYDYVLIDSRTGLSDVADICTVHLPDVVVDCFTLATQGIEGAADVARMIQAHTDRDITLLPVPMRIDHAQKEKVDAGLGLAMRLFAGLPEGMSEEQRRQYWTEVEVPYRASYAYEETLAAFADRPGTHLGLLPFYERITAEITGGAVTTLPPRDEWLRLRTRLLFTRTQSSSPLRVLLDFSPADQLWAEWIAAVLASAEISVRFVGEETADPDEPEVPTQSVAIGTDAYFIRMPDSAPGPLPDRLICVTDTRVPSELADVPVMFLAGLTEIEAKEALVGGLGGHPPADLESGTDALRYPGGDRPLILNIPGRNVNFTGRDSDLRELREELGSTGAAVMRPVTVLGRDGVGKTQVALEYAHRFKSDYDIVWWMNCGAAQYVDASLADLGQAMRETFKSNISEEGAAAEIARQVLQLLGEGNPDQRWLLIYDNAEDIGEIGRLLPAGRGHVLITSRNAGWKARGQSLEIGVFRRDESISHLRRRLPDIADLDADRLAAVLGDMPLAVAAAGAYLASTGDSVDGYLAELGHRPGRALPEGHPLRGYPPEVAKAFDLSLDLLLQRSAAAARLLEICSAMAPDISLGLIDTQAMADTLRDLDPAISERAMIAMLIRQIDLLALIKLDNNAREIQVHRVVQAAVNERMSEQEKAAARRDVHQLVVAARPQGDVDDPQTWPRYRLIWPHLTPSGAMRSTEAPVRDLLIERVRYLRERDDLERGSRRAKEIEAVWTSMLGQEPDPELSESLLQQLYRLQFNRANILRDQALFQEARSIDEAVVAGQTQHLGPEHPNTLRTRSSLAADRRATGDYDAALALDLETHEFWNKRYGEEYRGTLVAAHNLALSQLLTGDFRSALAQDRLTLERRISVQGAKHPRTLGSGASVARDLLEAGRYGEAVSRMQAVYALSRDVLGADARNTLTAQLLLGVAQRCAGHPDRAANSIEAAMTGLTRGFGADSSDALASRLSQTLNQLALQNYEEARTAAEGVLAVYEQRLGPTHPHSLICRLNISTALCLEGENADAETEARAAADGLRTRLDASHPYTLAANMVLASVLANQEDFAQAEQLERMVTQEREVVLGPRHPDTLRCRANLLLTRHSLGDDEASGERQEIIAELTALIGSEHPDVTTAMSGARLLCVIDPLPF